MKYYRYLVIVLFLILIPLSSEADKASDLRDKIDEKASDIADLEKEIKEYEIKIEKTQQESKTLSGAIERLDVTRKKLQTDIKVTENRIDNANLNIEKLSLDINEKEIDIAHKKEALSHTIRSVREAQSASLVQIMFQHDSLSEFWSTIDNLQMLQKNITVNLEELRERKNELRGIKGEEEKYKGSLVSLNDTLVDQKKVADVTRNSKSTLLKETKNKQSEYEKLVAEKKAKKQAFEDELFAFEAELKEVLDPSALPAARSGVLDWPLKGKIIITQYFGNTPFATKNPSVYGGKGHNGVDLAAPIGTPLYSPRDGRVIGTGDTDNTCRNASYGKWVLIEHDNGLSTLHAHLSLIKVSKGETLARGDVFGYTGNTGYSTGPHLHFTVFASNAVKVGSLQSRSCRGAVYTLPLLSKSGGYLNPLSYLPGL